MQLQAMGPGGGAIGEQTGAWGQAWRQDGGGRLRQVGLLGLAGALHLMVLAQDYSAPVLLASSAPLAATPGPAVSPSPLRVSYAAVRPVLDSHVRTHPTERPVKAPAKPAKALLSKRSQTRLPQASQSATRRTPPSRPSTTSSPRQTASSQQTTSAVQTVASRQATGGAGAVQAARFDAAYLNNPQPVYPAFSRRLREEGKVLLKVQVSAAGAATHVQLASSSGYERLDAAALQAVTHWRFVPAREGGQARASWVLVPVNFTLRG